jgi:hypothetical protein
MCEGVHESTYDRRHEGVYKVVQYGVQEGMCDVVIEDVYEVRHEGSNVGEGSHDSPSNRNFFLHS